MTAFNQKMDELNAKAQQMNNLENEEKEERQRELDKKNNNFYMIFRDKGSPIIRQLIAFNPIAANLFIFLAEEMDRTNMIVASGKALATSLEVSEASISRAIKILLDENLIDRFKSGGSNVFVLNPEIVWSAWKSGKEYCLFGNAKVLISQNEQDTHTKKRLNVILDKKKQQPLLEAND